MSSDDWPPTVRHPDGRALWWDDGWRHTSGRVPLDRAMSWAASEDDRNDLIRAHCTALYRAVERGDLALHARLLAELCNAAQIVHTGRLAERLGVTVKTLAGYISAGKLLPAMRRPGKRHGRTHLFSPAQAEEIVRRRQ